MLTLAPYGGASATRPYIVRFLRVPIVPFSFPSTAERDRFLESWAEGCRNAAEDEDNPQLPVEGVDYELTVNLEGTV